MQLTAAFVLLAVLRTAALLAQESPSIAMLQSQYRPVSAALTPTITDKDITNTVSLRLFIRD